MEKNTTMSDFSTNAREELQIIEDINDALDNLRSISSTGNENSICHLLDIPEIGELDDLDDATIDFVESFITDSDEQRLILDTDDVLTPNENTDDTINTNLQNLNVNDADTSANAASKVASVVPNSETQSSESMSSGSKWSFFSTLFGANKDSTASSSTSSTTSKNSYLSRIWNRRKPDAESPVSNFSIPSCNSQEDERQANPADLALAEHLIQETEAQGPAGTPHLSSLARTVNRPILAFSSSLTLRHHAGRDIAGSRLRIQFHSARPGMATGHWTLLGNKDPDGLPMSLNNCLFNVICAQTGRKPSALRQETIKNMRKHIKSLARRIHAMMQREDCGELIILIGGARYSGNSPSDAQRVIDDSQNGTCHPGYQRGHPRGHASHPAASGATDSAENYSRGGWKTGFQSRADQNSVGNDALRTPAAQSAMDALNRGSTNEVIRLNASELPQSLPPGAEFRNGNMESPRPIRQLVLVLRHHTGQQNNPDYPVFVHTFYPVVT